MTAYALHKNVLYRPLAVLHQTLCDRRHVSARHKHTQRAALGSPFLQQSKYRCVGGHNGPPHTRQLAAEEGSQSKGSILPQPATAESRLRTERSAPCVSACQLPGHLSPTSAPYYRPTTVLHVIPAKRELQTATTRKHLQPALL